MQKQQAMPQCGDIISLKKPHACGGDEWLVQRTGMDFGLCCRKCKRNILLPRKELQRQLKAIIKTEVKDDTDKC